MKRIVLSNLVEVSACVGDGFDGSSGVYFHHPDLLFKGGEVPIPPQDIPRVCELMKWYVEKEMALRQREGESYRYLNGGKPTVPADVSNPYQVNFYIGYLAFWPTSQALKRNIAREAKARAEGRGRREKRGTFPTKAV